MIPITRKIAGVERYFEVYTKEEADEKGIEYVYWNKVKEGEWGLTDDNMVGECFRITVGRGTDQLHFSFGRPWRKAKVVNALEFIKAGAYSRPSPVTHGDVEAKTQRAKRVVLAAARQILDSGKTDDHILAKLYRPKHRTPIRAVRSWLKAKKCQEMIMDEIQKLLSKHEITQDFALEKFKKWGEMAEKDGKPSDMRDFVERAMDLTGVTVKKKVTEEMGFDYTTQVGGKRETARLTAKRTQELPSHMEEDDFEPEG